MLPLKASWSGRTFALARGSDSPEKKSRRRRTKEERRTMVESFIKKYQNSNNGSFPSLNLTHKEVGGSFYTIREIVREIIQENKVLRPGSMTSKALNLEDCLEEYALGSLSMDPHAIAEGKKEHYSLSSECQMISEEGYEIVNSESPDSLISHSNGFPVSTVMHDESSDLLGQNILNATHLDGNLMFVDNEKSDLRESSGSTHDNSESHEYTNSKVQDHSSKDCNDHKLSTSVSIIYSSSELGVDGCDLGNKGDNIAGTTNPFAESNDVSEITGQSTSPEYKTLLNSGNNNMSSSFQGDSASATREVLPLAYTDNNACNIDGRYVEVEDLTSSLEVLQSHNVSNEMEVATMPVDRDTTINRTEQVEILSSNPINEAAETRLTPPMSSTFETTKIEAQSVLQPSSTGHIVTNTGIAFSESHSPEVNGIPSIIVKTEFEDIASKSNSSTSQEKGKESSEKEEINPVWAAFKALVAAVVKFWTE